MEFILARFSNIRKQTRYYYFLYGIATLIIVLCLFLIALFFIDYLFHLHKIIRILLAISGAVFWIILLYLKVIFPLTVKISDDDIALLLERQYPHLKDCLISTIQFTRHQTPSRPDFCSPQLIQETVKQAIKIVEPLNFNKLINPRPATKKFALATFTLAGLIWGCFLSGDLSLIFFQRLFGQDVNWPKTTHLKVYYISSDTQQPKEFINSKAFMIKDEDFKILVNAMGKVPNIISVIYEYETGEKGATRVSVKTRKEQIGNFEYTFQAVRSPFKFYVKGGDDTTSHYYVDLLVPPDVENPSYMLEYPSYAKDTIEPQTHPLPLSDFEAPALTRVKIFAQTQANIDRASINLEIALPGAEQVKKETKPMKITQVQDKSNLEGEFILPEGIVKFYISVGKYMQGIYLSNTRPFIYIARGQPDKLPLIRVIEPVQTETLVSEDCQYPLSIEASDDYMVISMWIEYKVEKKSEPQRREFEQIKQINKRHKVGTYTFSVADTGAKVNDRIDFFFFAKDNREIEPRKEATTSYYRFFVVEKSEIERIVNAQMANIRQRIINLRKQQSELTETLLTYPQDIIKLTGVSEQQDNITRMTIHVGGDLNIVINMGKYNKIFDEVSCSYLERALKLLKEISGSEDSPVPGLSQQASSILNTAGKSTSEQERKALVNKGIEKQEEIFYKFGEVLNELKKWSDYEEVKRKFRELKQLQEKIIQILKDIFDRR